MANRLRNARAEIRHASEHADADVREQLRSIEEGLSELVEGEKTQEGPGPKPERLEELERKLAGLEEQVDDRTRERIEDARDALFTYRRNQSATD